MLIYEIYSVLYNEHKYLLLLAIGRFFDMDEVFVMNSRCTDSYTNSLVQV